MNNKNTTWYRVLGPDELPDGRVRSATCAGLTLCMTHFEGQYAALDNKCPHQGGPLGEGSIENGLLRCPWHGWDYHPLTGKAPGFDDGVATFPVDIRDDGMNITHVLLNNDELGKISKEQRVGNWEVWQTSLHNPSFAKYAELCGAYGVEVTDASRLGEAMGKALEHNGPALIEIRSDPELV